MSGISGVYTFDEKTGQLFYGGRRVPRLLNLEYPIGISQMVLDLLCHFFRDELEPERKAYALHRRACHALATRIAHIPTAQVTDDEMCELVTTILCDWKERLSGKSDLVYISGDRRDLLRLQ